MTVQVFRVLCLLVAIPVWVTGAAAADTREHYGVVRIGVTPVFLDYQTALLGDWQQYLETRLQRPVKFTQRSSYREIMELLLADELEFAWICGYPFVSHRPNLRLLAVPIYQGQPLYQSYLIVPRSDDKTRSIVELKGKLFAYSDPDSNSGYLVPQYQLYSKGEDRDGFFRKAFFTWAHQKVVEAVAAGLADGGAVDGYVWDTLEKVNPALTAKTRVVTKSEKFGFPPFVARRHVPDHIFDAMQHALTQMTEDPQGQSLLNRLNLDGFNVEKEGLFDSIAELMKTLPTR
ncbi:MAG: phosphate/phosphite/phosphonate ABC transporter substrate-binding protein [Gammaproteobacteria bacterium]|nr:phosphate/phosphite/phosphonate ABC transporter substrate-binding protein [Gammaproteobacteria bacterium]